MVMTVCSHRWVDDGDVEGVLWCPRCRQFRLETKFQKKVVKHKRSIGDDNNSA